MQTHAKQLFYQTGRCSGRKDTRDIHRGKSPPRYLAVNGLIEEKREMSPMMR
jgi:hypothetical protein